ncbi:hypothetical protein F4821DRAFT_266199 [Hypoxylon rubiginosum]|uniref:Uncharacterized protein n=1 Tax=Hypoxylon rubiginosum TaxID=110542 RepID=A0ACC0CIA1_9PEZI|nr:hypothetical protein F4821DRAFT_266199 [Hypoxylon rubiginosum]
MDLLQAVFNHLVLSPQLPGGQDSDIKTISHDVLQRMIRACEVADTLVDPPWSEAFQSWFEAQLIHYGLPPSKTKAVARMRLYDAVNGNYLSVPSHIKKLELDLKKEWPKNERETKKALKEIAPPAVKSAKRKAESSNVDVTVNVDGVNITFSTTNASKKAKTATPKRASQTTKKQPESNAKAPKAVAAPKPKAPAYRI